MKSFASRFLFFLFATSGVANALLITRLSDVEKFDIGQVVSYNGDFQLEADRGWLGPKGDVHKSNLERPKTTYFIDMLSSRNHIYVTIGCRVVKSMAKLAPLGFGTQDPDLDQITDVGSAHRSPYYVSAEHSGGIKSQTFVYDLGTRLFSVTSQNFEFKDGQEAEFKETLGTLFRDLSLLYKLSDDSYNAVETAVEGQIKLFIPPLPAEPAQQQNAAMAIIKSFVTKVAAPSVEESGAKAQGYLNAMTDYRERVIRSKHSNKVMLTLTPYPVGF